MVRISTALRLIAVARTASGKDAGPWLGPAESPEKRMDGGIVSQCAASAMSPAEPVAPDAPSAVQSPHRSGDAAAVHSCQGCRDADRHHESTRLALAWAGWHGGVISSNEMV